MDDSSSPRIIQQTEWDHDFNEGTTLFDPYVYWKLVHCYRRVPEAV